MTFEEALPLLIDGRDLDQTGARGLFDQVLGGELTAAQIAAVVTALAAKGESVAEVAGAAEAMRAVSTKVDVTAEHLVDTCGTGGSGGAKRFNISTAAAFVAAAAGAHVAKHGNRGMTSKSGSADVLEAAGVKIDLAPAEIARCVSEVGVGFMFAQAHHSAMRFAAPVRRELGFRTIFNVLGPLTNPAGAKRQLLGVFAAEWQRPLAEVAGRLGAEHVMVVHSEGLDELSIAGPSRIAEWKDGRVEEYEITPQSVGIEVQAMDDLQADSPEASLALVRSALNGAHQAASDVVALNAGAAIYVAGIATSLHNGVLMAQDAIAAGLATERLGELVNITQLMGGRVNPPDILAKIVAHKRLEVDDRRAARSMAQLEALAMDAAPCRGFADALTGTRESAQPGVIAEIKKASPSEGVIRADFDPPAIAQSYAQHGATCLSILTDEHFFQGSDDYLREGRAAVHLPVLRKDFTIDAYQIVEARVIGADAILLIAAILSDAELASFTALATDFGLDVLIEVHDEGELDRALALSPKILGINNRDLRNFTTSLATTTRMLDRIPDQVLVVSESGIKTPDDVAELEGAGVPAFLVGTAFMRSPEPGVELARLFENWRT